MFAVSYKRHLGRMAKMAALKKKRKGWEALGKLLRESRECQRWSLRDLTSELGVSGLKISASAISSIERGNVEPKLSTLVALIKCQYIKDPCTGKLLELNDVSKYLQDCGGEDA